MNFGTIQVADIFVGALNAIEAYFGTEKVWEKSAPPTGDWLCFTAQAANSEVGMYKEGSPDDISLVASTDGENWVDYNVGDPSIQLANIGDKVYFRAKTQNQTISKSGNDKYIFSISGLVSASGNV